MKRTVAQSIACMTVLCVVNLIMAGCGPRTDVPLLLKIENEFIAKEFVKFNPKQEYVLLVYWKKGFRMPKIAGERKLLCSDGTQVDAMPAVFNSKEYNGIYFLLKSNARPSTVRISGTVFRGRWVTMEEALRTTGSGGRNPDWF